MQTSVYFIGIVNSLFFMAIILFVCIIAGFLFSAHINGGRKSRPVMRFFLQILPKLHFISTPWSEVHVT